MSNNDSSIIKLNANADHMSVVLADLVRSTIRASINKDGSQQYQSITTLKYFLDLCIHSEDITYADIIEKTIDNLSVETEFDTMEHDEVSLAESATRFLIEKSSPDNFARGRAAARWRDFKQGMDSFAEIREYRLKNIREAE